MRTHRLPARKDTVRIDVIDCDHAPVLVVDDGDEVELET